MVTADITGDGQTNIVYGTDEGRLDVLGWDSEDGLVLRWSLDIGSEIGELAVADVNGDGLVEIVLTAADGFLYVVGDQTRRSAPMS
ncbi:hypothetical protein [Dactylosporangium sp. CA-233914]|uniref:hypothetical protein n=1 Tax=Dactylosporangium sp. CA-233914 TaxID=3239934 RepID=UPI003D93E9E0